MASNERQFRCLEDYQINGPPSSMYYLADFVTSEEEQELLRQVYAAPLPQWRTLTHRRLQSLPSPLSSNNVLLDSSMPVWLGKPIERIRMIPVNAENSIDMSRGDSQDEGEEMMRHVFADSPHQGPNHCLVNEYLPGQGIMPHEDGPAYYPITATISLGSHAILKVTRKPDDSEASVPASNIEQPKSDENQGEWSILCEARSLLITTSQAYTDTLHGIERVDMDTALASSDGAEKESLVPFVANWDLLGDKETWVASNGSKKRETRVSLTYRDVLKVKSFKALKSLNLGGGRR